MSNRKPKYWVTQVMKDLVELKLNCIFEDIKYMKSQS